MSAECFGVKEEPEWEDWEDYCISEAEARARRFVESEPRSVAAQALQNQAHMVKSIEQPSCHSTENKSLTGELECGTGDRDTGSWLRQWAGLYAELELDTDLHPCDAVIIDVEAGLRNEEIDMEVVRSTDADEPAVLSVALDQIVPVVTKPSQLLMVTKPISKLPVVTKPLQPLVVTKPISKPPIVTEPLQPLVVTKSISKLPIVTEPLQPPVVTKPISNPPVVTEPLQPLVVTEGISKLPTKHISKIPVVRVNKPLQPLLVTKLTPIATKQINDSSKTIAKIPVVSNPNSKLPSVTKPVSQPLVVTNSTIRVPKETQQSVTVQSRVQPLITKYIPPTEINGVVENHVLLRDVNKLISQSSVANQLIKLTPSPNTSHKSPVLNDRTLAQTPVTTKDAVEHITIQPLIAKYTMLTDDNSLKQADEVETVITNYTMPLTALENQVAAEHICESMFPSGDTRAKLTSTTDNNQNFLRRIRKNADQTSQRSSHSSQPSILNHYFQWPKRKKAERSQRPKRKQTLHLPSAQGIVQEKIPWPHIYM